MRSLSDRTPPYWLPCPHRLDPNHLQITSMAEDVRYMWRVITDEIESMMKSDASSVETGTLSVMLP